MNNSIWGNVSINLIGRGVDNLIVGGDSGGLRG